jgi:hypothetical protein
LARLVTLFGEIEVAMAKPIGKLKKMSLDEVWGHEPDGFAGWLQQEDILDMLGETIEVTIKPAGQEIPLNTLSGGVLAKDEKRGTSIIILGALAGITPDTLGKLVMYAAGLDAKDILCVGQSISPEIRQTLDWLNAVSRDGVNFYGMELELWRIDDSVPAPNFHVVCRPNLWARQLKLGQEDEDSGAGKPREFLESKGKNEAFPKEAHEKGAHGPDKGSGPAKEGVSVRQNFVYTKTFS